MLAVVTLLNHYLVGYGILVLSAREILSRVVLDDLAPLAVFDESPVCLKSYVENGVPVEMQYPVYADETLVRPERVSDAFGSRIVLMHDDDSNG